MPNRKLSILIVDADLLGREGLKRVLSDEYRNIEFGMAGTAEEALDRVQGRRWHVAILSMTLPDKDGFFVLQEIRNRCPQAAVLMRSVQEESVHGALSLQHGAAGYVSKSCTRSELLNAFRTILDGGHYFSKAIRRAVESHSAPQASLSAQELKVFLALAAGRSNTEIAVELNVSAKTVSTYKRRIFNKLNFKSTADLVRYQIDHKLS